MHLSRLSTPSFAIPQSRLTGNLGEDLQDFATDVEEFEETPAEDHLQDGAWHVSQVAEGSDINAGSVPPWQGVQNEMVGIFSGNNDIAG